VHYVIASQKLWNFTKWCCRFTSPGYKWHNLTSDFPASDLHGIPEWYFFIKTCICRINPWL
jgi:hypothetical protein